MKKVLLIVLVLVVLAVGGTVLFLQMTQKPVVVENVLPGGALMYKRSVDVEKKISDLTATHLWRQLETIDYKSALRNFGVAPDAVSNLDVVSQKISSPVFQAFLKKFFGREVAVAIYPADITEFNPAAFMKMAENVFFVTRLAPQDRLAEFIPGLLNAFNNQITTQTFQYKKHTVYLVSTKDGIIKIGYTRIGDLLIFGYGDNAARSCLDAFLGQKKSLAQDSRYLDTKTSFLAGADTVGYMDYGLLLSTIKAQVLRMAAMQKGNPESVQKQVEENFKKMEGFRTIGFSGVMAKDYVFKFDLHFDRNALPPEVRSLYECQPRDNDSLKMVSSAAMGYQWSPCYDFKSSWQQMKKELEQTIKASGDKTTPQQMVSQMEQKLGVKIEEDILPALGKEVGGALLDIDTTNAFPLPKMFVFVEVADKDKAQKVMSTLLAQQAAVQPQTENYNGAVIKYVQIPLLPGFEPAYSLVGKYLVLATNRLVLKEAVDNFKDPGQTLATNPDFQNAKISLSVKNNSVLFLQLGQLLEKGVGVVDWGNKWISQQEVKEAAFKAGSEKRLADIQKEKQGKENSLQALRDQLAGLNEQAKVATPSQPVNADSLKDQLSQVQSRLDDKVKEITAAKAAAAATDTTLLDQARQQLEQKVADLNKQITQAQQQSANQQKISDQRADLEKQITAGQQDAQALQATEKELQNIIKGYDNRQGMDPKIRSALVEDFIKPLLQALSSAKIFAVKSVFGDNILETFIYLKVE